MIDVVIKMSVVANKRTEILDSIRGLLVRIRCEQGCISCHCYPDAEAEDVVVFKQEWKNNAALASHLRSAHFKVLLEVMTLLSIKPEIRVNTFVMQGLGAIAVQDGKMPKRSQA